MADDLDRLASALSPVQEHARGLRWARERPWQVGSHLWREGQLPVVDLHDLDVKGARQAVDAVALVAHELDSGAVAFVTGRGRHSVGKGKLGPAVQGALAQVCRERGWQHGPLRAGRQVLVVDPRRAPAAATGRLGWGFWLGAAAFAAAALVAFPPLGAVVCLVLLGLAVLSWRDRR